MIIEFRIYVAAPPSWFSADKTAKLLRTKYIHQLIGYLYLQTGFCGWSVCYLGFLLRAHGQHSVGHFEKMRLTRTVLAYDHIQIASKLEISFSKDSQILNSHSFQHHCSSMPSRDNGRNALMLTDRTSIQMQ
jgi:hypothetical protein